MFLCRKLNKVQLTGRFAGIKYKFSYLSAFSVLLWDSSQVLKWSKLLNNQITNELSLFRLFNLDTKFIYIKF